MGFTVTRPGGSKDAEFEAYVRLLRQRGENLGNLPRVPDPENPKRRWAYLWNTKEEAQQFADELKEETGYTGWRVEKTAAPPSNGPFGPVLFQLARRSDGSVLVLHPLSLALIREAFPETVQAASNVVINAETMQDFLQRHLVEIIAPCLTGLSMDQLNVIGYAVIDADDDRSWIYVPPQALPKVKADPAGCRNEGVGAVEGKSTRSGSR